MHVPSTSAASGQESTQRPELRAGAAAGPTAGLTVVADSEVRRAAKVLNRFHLVALEEMRRVDTGGFSSDCGDSFNATLRVLSNE